MAQQEDDFTGARESQGQQDSCKGTTPERTVVLNTKLYFLNPSHAHATVWTTLSSKHCFSSNLFSTDLTCPMLQT